MMIIEREPLTDETLDAIWKTLPKPAWMAKPKILLINPAPIRKHVASKAVQRIDPPVGLLFLASYLEPYYDVEICNTAFQQVPMANIIQGKYILVGFTVFIGAFLKEAAQISKDIKAMAPETPIVWGGPMASAMPGEILERYPQVDAVCEGAGEEWLLTWLTNLQTRWVVGRELAEKECADMELLSRTLTIPNWKLLCGDDYTDKQQPYYYRIYTSRGCPFRCSFCYRHQSAVKWEPRPAEDVCLELDTINADTGTIVFTLGDDNAFVDRARMHKILDHCRERGYYLEQAIAHVNNLHDDIIDALGGILQTMCYSIETASPERQKAIHKHIPLDRVYEVNKRLADNGITTIHNFLVGFPDETDAELRANVEMMYKLKEINPYARAYIYILLPLPKTPIRAEVEAMGYELPSAFDMGCFDEIGSVRHRPWLSEERLGLLERYQYCFNKIFQANHKRAEGTGWTPFFIFPPELDKIFEGANSMRVAREFNHLYVLDRVLRGETIDLKNDMARTM